MSVAPDRKPSSWALEGALTPSTTSARSGSPMAAPASTYAASAKLDAAPAPVSTTTS